MTTRHTAHTHRDQLVTSSAAAPARAGADDSRIPIAGPLDHTPAVLLVRVAQRLPPLGHIRDVLAVVALLVRTQALQGARTAAPVGPGGQMADLLARGDREGRKEDQAGQADRGGQMGDLPAVLVDPADQTVVVQGDREDLAGQGDHASQAYFHPGGASRDAEVAFLPGDLDLDAGLALVEDEEAGDRVQQTLCVAVAHLQPE